jgi:hypothetical protein
LTTLAMRLQPFQHANDKSRLLSRFCKGWWLKTPNLPFVLWTPFQT